MITLTSNKCRWSIGKRCRGTRHNLLFCDHHSRIFWGSIISIVLIVGIFEMSTKIISNRFFPQSLEVTFEEVLPGQPAIPSDSKVFKEIDSVPAAEEEGLAQKAATQYRIGRDAYDSGMYESAAQHFLKALEMYQTQSLYLMLGNSYYQARQHQLAVKNSENALAESLNRGDTFCQAAALNNLGLVYKRNGELQRGLKYHERALIVHQGISDNYSEGNTLYNMGSIYYLLGDMEKAMQYFDRALIAYRIAHNLKGEATTLSKTGHVYFVFGDMEKALKYLGRAEEIFKKIGADRQVEIAKDKILEITARMEES